MDAPNELEFRLHDHIDPGALDSLMENSSAETTKIRILLPNFHVQIFDTERIVIRERDS